MPRRGTTRENTGDTRGPARLRTVLRLARGCTFEVMVRDCEGQRTVALVCPGDVVIVAESGGVVDRLAMAAMEASELFGNPSGRSAAPRRLGHEPHVETSPATVAVKPPTSKKPEILSVTETAVLLGVSRATLLARQRTAWGPAPVDAGAQTLTFRRTDVLGWLQRSAS